MRREAPVARNPRPSLVTGDVLLSRHADVYETLRDHQTFPSDPNLYANAEDAFRYPRTATAGIARRLPYTPRGGWEELYTAVRRERR